MHFGCELAIYLTCCHPQQGFRPNLHGDLLKGYMDLDLYKKIIDGIERAAVCERQAWGDDDAG